MMMMVATRASQVEEVEAEDTILACKQPNMMMMLMLICVLPETDVHFAVLCRLVPVHCMPNVTKTVSRTSLSTECLSAEPFNLSSVSFSQAIITPDVSPARQHSAPM